MNFFSKGGVQPVASSSKKPVHRAEKEERKEVEIKTKPSDEDVVEIGSSPVEIVEERQSLKRGTSSTAKKDRPASGQTKLSSFFTPPPPEKTKKKETVEKKRKRSESNASVTKTNLEPIEIDEDEEMELQQYIEEEQAEAVKTWGSIFAPKVVPSCTVHGLPCKSFSESLV